MAVPLFPEKKYRQQGLSLTELMVAMVISLITVLVIMQVFSVFEEQKRNTMGGADAQTNGSMALFRMQRDIMMSGFGIMSFTSQNNPWLCNPSPTIDHDADGATPVIDIFPVVITDGGTASGATDTVAVRYGATPMGGAPSKIISLVGDNKGVDVENNLACVVGDVAILVTGPACTLTRVTGLPSNTRITLDSAVGAVTQSTNLACLGNWSQFIYRANNGRLEVNGVPDVSNIVNIQAQYGISASQNNNQITAWVDAKLDALSGIDWSAPSVANRNRIKAVRIAVVARDPLLQKRINEVNPDTSAPCSSETAAAPTGVCAWAGSVASPAPKVDLGNDPDWGRYRYKVFQTIIPIRNMIWSKDSLS